MSLIKTKLARIRAGGPIRSMDLFAGCGGLSLGFLTAGFTPVASVEIDGWAAASHGQNFAAKTLGGKQDRHRVARDINKEDPAGIFADLGIAG